MWRGWDYGASLGGMFLVCTPQHMNTLPTPACLLFYRVCYLWQPVEVIAILLSYMLIHLNQKGRQKFERANHHYPVMSSYIKCSFCLQVFRYCTISTTSLERLLFWPSPFGMLFFFFLKAQSIYMLFFFFFFYFKDNGKLNWRIWKWLCWLFKITTTWNKTW